MLRTSTRKEVMSGGGVSYHLRPNKAVDREIFFDVLSHLQRIFAIRNYTYISMGGPYMEDFRVAYRALGITKHISVESKEAVCRRQKFNSPIGGVTFINLPMARFISEYESKGPAIFWLDYASTDREGQIRELQILLGKAQHGDVIKITLNADPVSIAPPVEGGKSRTLQELADAIVVPLTEKFKIEEADLKEFMDSGTGKPDPRLGMARALARYAKRQCGEALKSRAKENLVFFPLTAFRYTDERQQMLTLTGVLLSDVEEDAEPSEPAKVLRLVEEVLSDELRSKDWEDIHLIDVPDLSIREKLTVDSVAFDVPPSKALELMDQTLGQDHDTACESVDSYRKFARYYPMFGRLLS